MSERFFIDHGVIHDGMTGKHVTLSEDGDPDKGLAICCNLMNDLAAPTRTQGAADDARPVAIQDLYEVAPIVDKWMRDKAVVLAGDQYANLVDLAATVFIATRDTATRAQAPDSAAKEKS
jgi:hypothetical protein